MPHYAPDFSSEKIPKPNDDSTDHASRFTLSGTYIYPQAMKPLYQKSFRKAPRIVPPLNAPLTV